ncbi:MAG: ATP-binding cassette domain-containing protein [Spirochaetes bacterium]|nr:ATP-binding cassette domain-containing protein [Spirochaetota bacterium]
MKLHLEVKNLTKIFKMHILNGKEITAFKNISFDLNRGKFIGISGKSGYGKSSLIKCIYRNYKPTSGTVNLYDENGIKIDLTSISDYEMLGIRNNRIGYVSQFLQILPRVTAMNIITEPLIDKGWKYDTAADRAVKLLKLFDIPKNLWDAFPSTFSGGEKQRINLLRTIIDCPEMVIFDEPTASLDGKNRKIIMEIIKEMKKQGITMIGIFHDRKELEELSDEIFQLVRSDGFSDEADVPEFARSSEEMINFKL